MHRIAERNFVGRSSTLLVSSRSGPYLLILRVDLYVRPGAREWGYSDEADDAFDYFADALARSQIVPDVVGWMIAREDGIEREAALPRARGGRWAQAPSW